MQSDLVETPGTSWKLDAKPSPVGHMQTTVRHLTSQALWTLLALSCLSVGQSHAQEPDRPRRQWVTAGLFFLGGQRPFFATYGEAATISYHYQAGAKLFSVRAVWTGDLCFVCDHLDEAWDIGVLYGRPSVSGAFHVSGSVGLGVTRVKQIVDVAGGAQRQKAATTVAATFQGQLFYPLTREFGIGVYGFGNINLEKPFFGATLNLQLGRLR